MVGRSDIFGLRGVLWDRRVVGMKGLEVRKGDGEEFWRKVLVVRIWSIHLSSYAACI